MLQQKSMGYLQEAENTVTRPGSGDKIGEPTLSSQVQRKQLYPNYRYVIFTIIGVAFLGILVGAGATILLLSHLLKL